MRKTLMIALAGAALVLAVPQASAVPATNGKAITEAADAVATLENAWYYRRYYRYRVYRVYRYRWHRRWRRW